MPHPTNSLIGFAPFRKLSEKLQNDPVVIEAALRLLSAKTECEEAQEAFDFLTE